MVTKSGGKNKMTWHYKLLKHKHFQLGWWDGKDTTDDLTQKYTWCALFPSLPSSSLNKMRQNVDKTVNETDSQWNKQRKYKEINTLMVFPIPISKTYLGTEKLNDFTEQKRTAYF